MYFTLLFYIVGIGNIWGSYYAKSDLSEIKMLIIGFSLLIMGKIHRHANGLGK